MTDEEAYKIWLEAYSKNYGSTGLMESVTISKQAWLAAVNYERESCAKFADLHAQHDGFHTNNHQLHQSVSRCSDVIAHAIRARGGEK